MPSKRRLGFGDRAVDLGQRPRDGGSTLALSGRADPDELLRLVDQRFGLVADIGLFATLAVLVGVRLGVLDHPVDLLLGGRRPSWILIVFSCRCPLSLAVTCTMPLASMSKVTSIWGTPRGAGGMSVSWNEPSSFVVRRDLALTLVDVDLHRRLACRRPW